jgi:hypothetical protein
MKDPHYTGLVRIKREHKPWVLIFSWLILMAVFVYGIVKLAELYEGKVDWP